MIDIREVADKADLIVNGYAFTECELGYRVLNLNNKVSAMVLSKEGEMLQTTMDDIEAALVQSIFFKDKEFLEDCDAKIL